MYDPCTYACVRLLGDVGVPPTVRAGAYTGRLRPELKSPVRVELEVHREPRGEAAAAPLVMGIAGRAYEYCRQWLQAHAAREADAAAGGAGEASAAVPPFVTHTYYSVDGVPPLHAVMTDWFGAGGSVPHDDPLYFLFTLSSWRRGFFDADGQASCECGASVDVGPVVQRLTGPACPALLCRQLWPIAALFLGPLRCRLVFLAPRLFRCALPAGEPFYEALLGLGRVWVNGRLVVDAPPAAYAFREGDAHPSGIDPASVRLAELRVAAIAAAIGRGQSQAEAAASGDAAVAAAVAASTGAESEAKEGHGAGVALVHGGSGSAAASSSDS